MPAPGAGGLFAEQSGPGQRGQVLPGRPRRLAGEDGRGVGGDVGAGVEGQQPQQSGRLIVQASAGRLEGGLHLQRPPVTVAVAEGFQTGAGVGKIGGQVFDGQAGIGGELGRGNRQCQRQPPAVRGDVVQGLVIPVRAWVVGTGPGEGVGDQVGGGLGIELVQADQAGREIRAAQSVAGGGQQPVPGVRGEQGQQLAGGAGVVGDDQDRPVLGAAGQLRPVQALLLGGGRRQAVVPDAQGPQQSLQRLAATDGSGRVVAVQVHEQRAAAEPVAGAGPVGGVQGQRGLADPCQPLHHHRPRTWSLGVEHAQQLTSRCLTADQVRGRRQRIRSLRRGPAPRPPHRRAVVDVLVPPCLVHPPPAGRGGLLGDLVRAVAAVHRLPAWCSGPRRPG